MGCGSSSQKQPALEHQQSSSIKKVEPKTTLYSWSDVQKHNQFNDGWIVIEDKVYDVTNFIMEHPGGFTVFEDVYGADATKGFNDLPHSAIAHQIMENYQIGLLAGGIHDTTATTTTATTTTTTTAESSQHHHTTTTMMMTASASGTATPATIQLEHNTHPQPLSASPASTTHLSPSQTSAAHHTHTLGSTSSPSSLTLPLFSLNSIASHTEKHDCWFTLGEKVYDVSHLTLLQETYTHLIPLIGGKDATTILTSRLEGKLILEEVTQHEKKYLIGHILHEVEFKRPSISSLHASHLAPSSNNHMTISHNHVDLAQGIHSVSHSQSQLPSYAVTRESTATTTATATALASPTTTTTTTSSSLATTSTNILRGSPVLHAVVPCDNNNNSSSSGIPAPAQPHVCSAVRHLFRLMAVDELTHNTRRLLFEPVLAVAEQEQYRAAGVSAHASPTRRALSDKYATRITDLVHHPAACFPPCCESTLAPLEQLTFAPTPLVLPAGKHVSIHIPPLHVWAQDETAYVQMLNDIEKALMRSVNQHNSSSSNNNGHSAHVAASAVPITPSGSKAAPGAAAGASGFHHRLWDPTRAIDRPYTPTCVREDGLMELVIKHYPGGGGSTYLSSLQVGDYIHTSVAKGSFELQPVYQNYDFYFLIAAGTGITPIYSVLTKLIQMIEKEREEEALNNTAANTHTHTHTLPHHTSASLSSSSSSSLSSSSSARGPLGLGSTSNSGSHSVSSWRLKKIVLLDCNRTEEDILLSTELDELLETYPQYLSIFHILSRPLFSPKNSSFTGHINEEILQTVLPPHFSLHLLQEQLQQAHTQGTDPLLALNAVSALLHQPSGGMGGIGLPGSRPRSPSHALPKPNPDLIKADLLRSRAGSQPGSRPRTPRNFDFASATATATATTNGNGGNGVGAAEAKPPTHPHGSSLATVSSNALFASPPAAAASTSTSTSTRGHSRNPSASAVLTSSGLNSGRERSGSNAAATGGIVVGAGTSQAVVVSSNASSVQQQQASSLGLGLGADTTSSMMVPSHVEANRALEEKAEAEAEAADELNWQLKGGQPVRALTCICGPDEFVKTSIKLVHKFGFEKNNTKEKKDLFLF